MFNFFRKTGVDVKAMLLAGWLRTMIERLNNVPLLREGRIGAFLARLPIVQPLRMGWAMVFKPRVSNWDRTGAVLKDYLAEQAAKRKAAHG